jgi:nucleoside-diphosphate-sugar epimerase
MLQHLHDKPRAPERVVVLGAAGFVGKTVTRRLVAAGMPVLPLTHRDLDLAAADSAEKLSTLLRPTDAVVAAAARSPCKTVAALVENMKMVRAMVAGLSRAPIAHVINISSDAVYADLPEPLTEEAPRAPTTMHGVMHLAREIAFAGEQNSPLAILRPSMLYGAEDPHNSYGPNSFRRLANAAKPIVLFGKGEERRDHVSIDDVAEITFRVLTRRSVGTLNIATGEVHSFRDMADMVNALVPHPVPIETTPRSGSMPHNGYRPFDTAVCRAAFPDFAYTPVAEGLAKAQRESQSEGEWRK